MGGIGGSGCGQDTVGSRVCLQGLVTKSTEEKIRIGFRVIHVDPRGAKAGTQLNGWMMGGATFVQRTKVAAEEGVRQRHG